MITVDTILSYTTCGETRTTTFGTWCHDHPSEELRDLADSLGRVGVAHWRAPDGSEYELRVERETFEQRCEYLRARAQNQAIAPLVDKIVDEYARESAPLALTPLARGFYSLVLASGRRDDGSLEIAIGIAQRESDSHGCALGRALLAMPWESRITLKIFGGS